MTREEAKELLPIIQAYAEGKIIQYNNSFIWEDVSIKENLNFKDSPSKYRIKPEPKYRQFKNQEECWNEMLKHQPFGWLIHKSSNDYITINIIQHVENILFSINNKNGYFTAKFLFANYIFTDGTPFGIKEE